MKINRNLTYLLLLVLTALAFTTCKSGTSPDDKVGMTTAVTERPNVIFIMADDLTTQAISAYGDIYKDIAPTPNMDRLAQEGMLFQDVLCTNGICGPSRAAILTGDYSHKNGYYKNESGGRFDTSKWTFPQAFQAAGYQTALFGKWHLGTDPVGFDNYKFHAAAGQQGLYWNPLYNINGKEVKHEGYATNLSTDFAINWLKADRQQDQPFLMLLQYKAPHRPWEPDRKYEQLWDDIEMPYPTSFNDDYKGRELTAGDTEMTMEHLSRRDMKLERPEGLKGKEKIKWDFFGTKNEEIVQPEGMTAEAGKKWRYQRYIKDYLACVRSVDDNIGRILDYLDENGLADNTMIVLTSDQGFYLGDHGFFDKRFIYEESLRMPFIVRYPKKIRAGSVNEDVITNVDFAPTLLETAGIEVETDMQGRSFAAALSGDTPADWRQSMYYHYYEFPFWHHVQPHYGIRTDNYTLAHFYYSIDKWEFYDNEKDPDQVINRINDPAYADVISKLKLELKALMKDYDNDLPLAEYRKISDKDFGEIVKNGEGVKDIITNKKK
ncbi:sulfatase family protein [Neolewinella persica]|uniref:sulfatase family protein n=1 Tax=Neolewinella persica TaxID=70998 RepID=UPI0003828B63|nr:sulfatase [Neolewinella persica]